MAALRSMHSFGQRNVYKPASPSLADWTIESWRETADCSAARSGVMIYKEWLDTPARADNETLPTMDD